MSVESRQFERKHLWKQDKALGKPYQAQRNGRRDVAARVVFWLLGIRCDFLALCHKHAVHLWLNTHLENMPL